MQVHRISKNTIQVTIGAEELKARGITMLDLLGNKSQIQNFFYQILNEVDTEHTFAQDDPVTFQVMPSEAGLELLITKLGEKDDDDDQDDLYHILKRIAPTKGLGPAVQEAAKKILAPKPQTDPLTIGKRRVFKISNLELVLGLVDALRTDGLASSLYTYQHNYYLNLAFVDNGASELDRVSAWLIAKEFGTPVSLEVFDRIYPQAKLLIGEDALGNLRRYFALV